MKMKKIAGLFFVIFWALYLSGCSMFPAGPQPSDVNHWQVGTSAGRLGRLTENQLAQLKQAGFDCIEIGLDRIRSADDFAAKIEQARQLQQSAQITGIKIWSIHIPYGRDIDISLCDPANREKALEEVSRMISLCEYIKPEKLVIHASFEPVPENERAQRFEACKESLAVLVKTAAVYNARLTVECLPRTCLGNTSSEILDLINAIDGLEVCCDVNHLLQETPQEFIKRVGSPITTLHISDYDGVDERHWLPGQGIINWNNVLDSLVNIEYQGPFMFESAGTAREKIEVWNKLKTDYLLSVDK